MGRGLQTTLNDNSRFLKSPRSQFPPVPIFSLHEFPFPEQVHGIPNRTGVPAVHAARDLIPGNMIGVVAMEQDQDFLLRIKVSENQPPPAKVLDQGPYR